MSCKIIMYHYIREFDNNIPNLKFFNVVDFEKQLNYFEKQFWFVNKTDWLDYLDWKKEFINWVILTFDDWLIDHYKYVLPILKKKKLWGIFFLSSWPLKNKKILNVHKIHYLLWKYNEIKLYKIYIEILNELNLNIDSFKIDNINEYNYQNLNNKSLLIKKINYLFTIDIQNKILDLFFEKLIEDKEKIYNMFYMDKKHIKELIKEWNIIWGHTENHIILSKHSDGVLENEILLSNKYLEKEFDIKIDNFAYPYWLRNTYNENTISFLQRNWVKNSFIVNPQDFNISNSRYKIPRYDCNLFKYWKIF